MNFYSLRLLLGKLTSVVRCLHRAKDVIAVCGLRVVARPVLRPLKSVARTTDHGIRTTDYGIRNTDYGLRTTSMQVCSDFILGIFECYLHRMQSSYVIAT